MTTSTISDLLGEYDRALDYTESLWADLTVEEVHWRESAEASAIGWHLEPTSEHLTTLDGYLVVS